MINLLFVAALSIAVVDQEAIERFVDQNRFGHNGPHVIKILGENDLNQDGVADKLVAYTFGWDEERHSRLFGHALVAFVSTESGTFKATNILLLNESDLIFYSEHKVETHDHGVVIHGKKRTPTDAMCCPTARGKIEIGLSDGSLKAIRGSWEIDTDLPQ